MTDRHVRSQIRDAFADLLKNLPTVGAKNVFFDRPYPLDQAGELPGFVVNLGNETAELMDMDGDLQRQLVIEVIGYDEGTEVGEKLDRIALEVEQALGADRTLGGLAKLAVLQSIAPSVSGEAKKRLGEIIMRFSVEYWTNIAAPETAA